MNKCILVYDASCPFCEDLAKRLQASYGVDILPNDSKVLPDYANKEAIKKDVHYFVQYRKSKRAVVTYSGVNAAIEILSTRHPKLATFCHFPIIKQVLSVLYFIIKKSRKFL